MKELRVYVNPVWAGVPGGRVLFYSRRADGPFYCWHYEDELGRWRVSRVSLSRLKQRVLCVANWSAVPAALQVRIGEHYLE